jgi:RNA polymerase sigma-70 factor (sigma-E family)
MSDPDADERDFSAYYAARYPRVRRVAYLMCGDWYRADDLAQAAFVRLATSWRRVRVRESLDAYLRTCLFREAVTESRRPWRRESAVDALPEPLPGPAAEEAVTSRMTVVAALRRLPPRQRAVLVCRYYEDLDVTATAAVLHCSTGTVKSQTARALGALRAALGEDGSPVGKEMSS